MGQEERSRPTREIRKSFPIRVVLEAIFSTPELTNAAQTAPNMSEVMWLGNLLPNFFPNARIATYSYGADLRKNVKTSLHKCGERFLNVLYQNRSGERASRMVLDISLFIMAENHGSGQSATVDI